MEAIIVACVVAVLAIAVTTITYHLLPFRKPQEYTPRTTWFPKYVQDFSIPVEEVFERVKDLGFVARDGSRDEFDRGKIYGDFSAKAMKLRIKIERDNNTIRVFAPYFGVVFGKGELWKIAYDITSQNGP